MKKTVDSIISNAHSLYAAGRCDEAAHLLADTFAEDRSETVVLTRLVELLIDSERYESALEFLENATLQNGNASVSFLHAICLEAVGDLAAAGKIANDLLEHNRLLPEALTLKGRLALRSHEYEEAETLFRKAIACDSGCGKAWYGLACLQRQREDTQAHFDFLRKAFLCSPESREIAIAFHERSLTVQQLPLAEAALHEALSGRRMDRRLRFLLIDILLRQTRFTDAMTEIESAMVDFGVDEGILVAALNLRGRLGPLSIPEEPYRQESVSLCMIVKNEKCHLARCLQSAKPVVDEIVIVDTGSTDETKEIAMVFGARVYDFPWIDDFSKARNFALSKASGDWILVLDADETLSAKDHGTFRQVLARSQSRPAAYRIQTRNYSNLVNTVGFRSNRGESPEEEGMGWYPSDKVRLFTNDPRIRFDYPVHELVEPSLRKLKIPIIDCPVSVHHYGTLMDAHLLEKTAKYRNLGQKKIKLYLKNSAALKELAIQSARIGSHSEALDLWRRFVRQQPSSAEAYLNMGTACWNLRRFGEAVLFAQKALRLDSSLKEAKFNMAFSLLLLGRGGEAKMLLEELFREQPDYLAAQFLLCVAYICQQEMAQAEKVFENLRSLPIGDYIGGSFLDVAKQLLSASRRDYARRTLEAGLNFGCANPEMRALFEKCSAAT